MAIRLTRRDKIPASSSVAPAFLTLFLLKVEKVALQMKMHAAQSCLVLTCYGGWSKAHCPFVERRILLIYKIMGQRKRLMLCGQKHRMHRQALAKLHIADAVSYHYAALEIYIREVLL